MALLIVIIVYGLVLSAFLARAGHRSRDVSPGETPRHRPTRILVVGATGGTGRELVEQALERGYAVTAFVRDPSALRVDHPQLETRQGNVLDYASVETAMRDQDAVLCALGHKRYFYPTRILSEGTQNILRAMTTHGVPRLVCETSLGIGDSVGRLGLYYTLFVIPLILPLYFWDKTRQERLIAESNVEWVIVRPAALTNAKGRGRFAYSRHVGSYLWTARIARADVADFMLNQLESDTCLGSAPGVAW